MEVDELQLPVLSFDSRPLIPWFLFDPEALVAFVFIPNHLFSTAISPPLIAHMKNRIHFTPAVYEMYMSRRQSLKTALPDH